MSWTVFPDVFGTLEPISAKIAACYPEGSRFLVENNIFNRTQMTNSQRLAIVRSHLCAWITNTVGETPSNESPILSESILIRDGHFCGRSFVTSQHRAIWFIEEDELKIQDTGGEVVAVFSEDEIGTLLVESTAADETTKPDVIKLDLDGTNVGESTRQDVQDDQDQDVRRAA